MSASSRCFGGALALALILAPIPALSQPPTDPFGPEPDEGLRLALAGCLAVVSGKPAATAFEGLGMLDAWPAEGDAPAQALTPTEQRLDAIMGRTVDRVVALAPMAGIVVMARADGAFCQVTVVTPPIEPPADAETARVRAALDVERTWRWTDASRAEAADATVEMTFHPRTDHSVDVVEVRFARPASGQGS